MKSIGAVSHEIIRDLRFQRDVKHVHGLGPRAVGELLAEIGADHSIMTGIEQKLARYAVMTSEQVDAASGTDWPKPVLRAVGEGE